MPIGIHHDGVIAFANEALVSLLRAKSAEELVGKRIFDFLPEKEQEMVRARIRAATQFGESPPPTETQFVARDGTLLDVETSAAPVVFQGRPAMIVLVRDITYFKRSEKEKEKLSQQMLSLQKLESLGVLAGGIAHDFNNLLMAILGNLDLALLSLPPTAQARSNLIAAENASRKAAELARQMLAFSGRGRFIVERVNLNHLIEEMTHLLDVSVPKKSRLRLDLSRELSFVDGDAAQLSQMLMNLVTNSAEALGDAEGIISVSTQTMHCTREELSRTQFDEGLPDGVYTILEVADTGCGMDEETTARVFDPFFSTKFTGRGLGLAAVLGIVRGHHGAIDVQSEKGRGARFRIYLPVARPSSVPPPSKNSLAPAQTAASGTVLLADDEEILRSVGSQMIARLGYEPLIASDGVEAVEIVRDLVSRGEQGVLTCVILDLKMPRMDGLEALREIRKLCPKVPAFLSSGYNEQDATEQFADLGLAGFIQKPYALKALSSVLKSVTR